MATNMRPYYTTMICTVLASIVCFHGSSATALAKEVGDRAITSSGAIVIDFETGMELYAYNADVRRGPASMTKMMTVYLVYEALANGAINFDTVVPISQSAYEMSLDPDLSNVPLPRSATYTVDELLDTAIVVSACGATAALAEFVAGTSKAFIAMMNAKAEEWGIDAIFFGTVGGVTATQMTPRAMAEITRNTLLDYPEVLEKTSKESISFRGRTYPSTNRLLGKYEGIDGFKTGTHPTVRANFSGTAKRGDTRIIAVTMGSSESGRFRDTEILLDYGFAAIEAYRLEAIERSKISSSHSIIVVNSVESVLETYSIDGNDFFSLLDIAQVLNGTVVQFSVDWDNGRKVITITNSEVPAVPGYGLSNSNGERKLPAPLESRVFHNGDELALFGISIDGDAYFILDEIGEALGFGVSSKLFGETMENAILLPMGPIPDDKATRTPAANVEPWPIPVEFESTPDTEVSDAGAKIPLFTRVIIIFVLGFCLIGVASSIHVVRKKAN